MVSEERMAKPVFFWREKTREEAFFRGKKIFF